MTVILAPYGPFRALDSSGNPLSGGKLFTYEAGTTTPKATYTDSTGITAHANPIVLDAQGYSQNGGVITGIWLATGSYKFVLKDSADVTLWTIDNIPGAENVSSNVVSLNTNTLIDTSYDRTTIVCTASITVSLFDITTTSPGFFFEVVNQSNGNVTIDPNGSQQINDGTNATTTLVLRPGDSVKVIAGSSVWNALFTTAQRNVSISGKFSTVAGTNLTIASDAITATSSNHVVDTEGSASTDNLSTINGGVDGQLLYLSINNNARTITLKHGVGNILTYSKSDYTLSNTDQKAVLQYRVSDTKWVLIDSSSVVPNYAFGYQVSIDAGDTDHDILIGSGVVTDENNTLYLRRDTSIIKQIDAGWVAGTNQGGLDTGAVAVNSQYYLWAIKANSSGDVDVLISLSGTSPTMPTGYTAKRIIGYARTNSSANLAEVWGINTTRVNIITSSATWTKLVGLKDAFVEVAGGGGSGAGQASSGTSGGNSSFGSLMTANGGTAADAGAGLAVGAGGTATGGNILNINGESGQSPYLRSGGGTGSGYGGNGGTNALGSGGRGAIVTSNGTVAGTAASGYGSGGGGFAIMSAGIGSGGGGGGAGGYSKSYYIAQSLASSVVVTIGAAGSGGDSGGAGTAGVCILTERY